jgi:hypothetical protein
MKLSVNSVGSSSKFLQEITEVTEIIIGFSPCTGGQMKLSVNSVASCSKSLQEITEATEIIIGSLRAE